MNPKRGCSHLLLLVLLSLFPMTGQAQLTSVYTPDQMLSVLGVIVEFENAGVAGDPMSDWESITGGAVALETSDVTIAADQFRTTITGVPYVEELTLRRPVPTQGGGVEEWLNEAISGRAQPRLVRTTSVQRDGSPGPGIDYFDVWPVRYVFPALDGRDEARPYESLVVKPTRVENSGGSGTGASSVYDPRLLLTGGFLVDGLPAGSLGVRSVSIGDLVFELIDAGGREYRTWSLGRSSVGPVTIDLPAARESGVYQWWEMTLQGRAERRDITVSLLDNRGEVARTFRFLDCSPIKYDHGDFTEDSSIRTETITLSVGRVEFNR